MIEIAGKTDLEDSDSSKLEQMDFEDVLSEFTEEDAIFIKNALLENKLIPQEIISFTKLSEV